MGSFKRKHSLVTFGDHNHLAGRKADPLEEHLGDCGKPQVKALEREFVSGLESTTSE